jgi:hypothetical protein
MSARSIVTKEIVDFYKQIDSSDTFNPAYIQKQLESLTDKQFDEYMELLANGEEYLHYFVPNLVKNNITVESNLKLARSFGLELFQRLWYTDPYTGMRTLSRGTALLLLLPVRMQAQMLEKKDSIPLDNAKVDELSGQVTGEDKGSRISFPELGSLNSEGLQATALELIKVRGGDREALQQLTQDILQTGEAKLTPLLEIGTHAQSQVVVDAFLNAMHFDTTFLE